MSNFITAINVVVPVFAMIAIGYFLRMKKVINQEYIDITMKLVFNLCLPAMLFTKVSTSDMSILMTRENGIFLIYVLLATFFVFFISLILSKALHMSPSTGGTFVQGSFRSNYVIIGSAILLNLFGDLVVPKIAVLVIAIVPLYNILAIIILSERESTSFIEGLKTTLIKIIKNPLIIGILLGFLVSLLPFQLPSLASESIHMVGMIGTPLGLLGIGAYFSLKQMDGIKIGILSVLLKVFVYPVLVTGLAYFLGFAYMELAVIFVLFGSPAAVSSFVMATAMNGDSRLAANIVILSTGISLFTLVVGLGLIGLL